MRTQLTHLAVQISASHPAGPARSGAVGLSVVAFGLALIALGGVPRLRTRLWQAQACAVTGHIADNLPGPAKRGKATWLPLIEFEANGVTVMSPLAVAASQQGWPLGDPVEVLYDPEDPRRFSLAHLRRPVSLLVIAGVAIIAAFFAVVS